MTKQENINSLTREAQVMNVLPEGLDSSLEMDSFVFGEPAAASHLQPSIALTGGVPFGTLPDSTAVNTASFLEKTHAVAFETGADVNTTQVIYEQGGTTRGLSLVVDNGKLYAALWNKAEGNWGFHELSTKVEANTKYTTALVMDGTDANNGSAKLYVNGTLVDDVQGNIGRLYAHGDNIGVGKTAQTTLIHNEPNRGSPFKGEIEKITQYNKALTGDDLQALQATMAEDWLPADEKVVMEYGSIQLSHNFTLVNLDTNFRDGQLAVFTSMTSFNGAQIATPRITGTENWENFPGSSFDIRIEEPDYLDGRHTPETVKYLATTAGVHELSDGTRFEVGFVNLDKPGENGWMYIDYSTDFEERPVILAQMQTANQPVYATTRIGYATTDGFNVQIETQEIDNYKPHGEETVAWMAIEQGSGTSNGHSFVAQLFERGMTDDWTDVAFNFENDTNEPAVFADINSHNGSDPAALRMRDLSNDGVAVSIQEDQSKDGETQHVAEDVAMFAIGSGDETRGVLTGRDLEEPDFLF